MISIEKNKLKWVYIITAIYVVINSVLIANEFYWFLLLPVAICILLLYLFSLDKLLLFIVFLTPLSVNLIDFNAGVGLIIPTEPLLFGILLLFTIKIFIESKSFNSIFKHPVSIAIFIYLGWILFTSLTSRLPLISFKFFLSRLWFIIPFYFLGVKLFKNPTNIKRFIWIYLIALSGVIFYTIYKHSLYGFNEEQGHWVMSPFFNDHTSYGAILAMFIPFTIFSFLFKKHSSTVKLFSLLIFVLLIIAITLSYSRAAWVSVAAAFMVLASILLRINYKWLLLGGGIVLIFFFLFQNQINQKLEKNRQDSSNNLSEHVQSISNISSDASNLERINRWSSAIRMFLDRPILGHGPGTYQFLYAPYQRNKEKTIISTNAGDRGTAHSEYIGPMAESGLFGMLSFLAIIIVFIHTSIKIYLKTSSTEIKWISITILLCMVTYCVHGLLNNFLDTDKASVPFWGFIAMIVALDMYHLKEKKVEKNIEEK